MKIIDLIINKLLLYTYFYLNVINLTEKIEYIWTFMMQFKLFNQKLNK